MPENQKWIRKRDVCVALVRKLFLLPTLLLISIPVSANPIYLKCVEASEVDINSKPPFTFYLTIIPGQDHGYVKFVSRDGTNVTNRRSNQSISSTTYTLNYTKSIGHNTLNRTYFVDRTSGKYTKEARVTTQYGDTDPKYTYGDCEKVTPAKTLF